MYNYTDKDSKDQHYKTIDIANLTRNSSVQLQDNRTKSAIQKKQAEALSTKQVQNPIQKKANNTGLPNKLKTGIENLSGYSMDDVKVHYNSTQPAQVNAHAYAQGTDIHIASGQEKHLPHEVWHVVQQKQGRVKPTMQMKGKVNVNDDLSLEKEADVMGAKALIQKKALVKRSVTITQNIVQQKKFTELTKEQASLVNVRFGVYLKQNIKAFRELAPMEIVKKIKDGTDYPELSDWLTDFNKPKEQKNNESELNSSASSSSPFSSSSRMAEKVLPETQTHHGTHVSFSTNVKSGIDGLFDLWYYHNLNKLDVDVKFSLSESPNRTEYKTLKSMEKFWTNKFNFKKNDNSTLIKINIHIIPLPKSEVAHFNFVTVTGIQNPNVLRSNQQFSTRAVEEDEASLQVSAHHEFGHVLGLGEEYGLSDHRKNINHHEKMMEIAGMPKLDDQEGNVAGSIMGTGSKIQSQHYIGILTAFCKLIKSPPSAWAIIPVS